MVCSSVRHRDILSALQACADTLIGLHAKMNLDFGSLSPPPFDSVHGSRVDVILEMHAIGSTCSTNLLAPMVDINGGETKLTRQTGPICS